MQAMTAAEFEARCLALIDHVNETREVITILKHGRPVAQLTPPMLPEQGYPQDDLTGSVQIHGDVILPALHPDNWDAVCGT